MRYKIDQLVQLIMDYRGKTPKKLGMNWTENQSDIVALSAKNIKDNKIVNTDKSHYGSEPLYKSWMKDGDIEPGDILITSEAPLGEVYLITKPIKAILSQRLFLLRFNKNIVNPWYIFALMNSQSFKSQLFLKATGTTVVGIKQKELRKIEIELPNIRLQNKIGYIFRVIYKKIIINEIINDNLLELMDSRFNHFISNSKLTDATLSDITDIHSGGNKPKEFSKVKTNKFCIPVYSNGVSNNGLYGFTNKAKVNERSVSISARGTIGFTVLHNEPFVPIVRLIYLTSKSVPINFLYLFVRSMNIQGYGSTQQQITVPYLKSLKIKVPDISEINKFDANNISAFDLILENKKENILLSDIKETLLNKYF